MNVKKAVKKIAAVGAGALLVGSTILGASAASLDSFPQPFVTADGQGDVQFVIGSGSTDDYLGALDIAIALQAAAVSEESVNVPGTGTTVSVSDGFVIGGGNDPLLLGGTLSGVEDKLTDSDLPSLLADGIVEDEDGDEYDYTQELSIGASVVKYDTDDSDIDDPTLYLDIEAGTYLWSYTLDFTGDTLDLTGLDDSETIEILGKVFTVASDVTATGEYTLYGSDVTSYLELNEPVTVELEGESYTIEIVGANQDSSNIILDVNGNRKTVTEGDSTKIGGLDVYIEDTFITDIPVLSASANVFVGSQEVKLTTGQEVKIDDESIEGLTFTQSGNNSAVSSMTFAYAPEDLANDIDGFDETNFLLAGDSITDPLFGTFSVEFIGGNFDLMDASKTYVEFEQSGESLEMTFTNDDGDEINFKPYELVSGNSTYYFAANSNNEGFNGVVQDNIADETIFIVNEQSGSSNNTLLFEVTGFNKDGTTEQVSLKNLASGESKNYKAGDELGDSNIDIESVNYDHKQFNLSAASAERIYVDGGYNYFELGNETEDGISFFETAAAVDDATPTTMTFRLDKDSSESDEFDIRVAASGTFKNGVSDDNDNKMYLSAFGTYVDTDVDEDTYVKMWVPMDEDGEVSYTTAIVPSGASITTSGSSSGDVVTQTVNKLAVGVAIRDTEVSLANPAKNLIVVGGTCINSIAAELKGVSAGTCGTDSGLEPNQAIIELFDLDNGKVAMLVAGWEAEDTQAAARAVATMDSALSGSSVMLTVTSANNYQIQ